MAKVQKRPSDPRAQHTLNSLENIQHLVDHGESLEIAVQRVRPDWSLSALEQATRRYGAYGDLGRQARGVIRRSRSGVLTA